MFTCLGFSPRLEPINNALIKLDVHAPESNLELIALPIERCMNMVNIIRNNSEPVKREHLPRELNAFTFSTERFCYFQRPTKIVYLECVFRWLKTKTISAIQLWSKAIILYQLMQTTWPQAIKNFLSWLQHEIIRVKTLQLASKLRENETPIFKLNI